MTTQKLDLQTGLNLRLSQKMQQAIKMLQMDHVELSATVAMYVEQNPLLEMEEECIIDHENEQEKDKNNDEDEFSTEESTLNDLYDEGFDNYYQDDRRSSKNNSQYTDDFEDIRETHKQPVSFRQHVLGQIEITIHKEHQPLAFALFELLDERGYLLENFKEMLPSSFQESNIDTVLWRLQTLEPCGIFARSLNECILLQLRDKGCDHPRMEEFLDFLTQTQGDISKISKRMNLSLEACRSLLALIAPLDPKPALSYGGGESHTVIPDILILRKNDGTWGVELNPATNPYVNLNQNYYISLKPKMKNFSEKHYLQDKFQEGKWLLKSLQQRAINMKRVAEEILRQQSHFFASTKGRIKPLTLKEIAAHTDLSESTVSRITTGKYIQTPRGTFELKYFFSNLASEDSDHQSSKSVQQAIKMIVSRESPTHPLSDTEIAEKLSLQGMGIARRTVAKYRDILKIDNVSARKKTYEWQQVPVQRMQKSS